MIKMIGVTVSKHDNKIVLIMQYCIDKSLFCAISLYTRNNSMRYLHVLFNIFLKPHNRPLVKEQKNNSCIYPTIITQMRKQEALSTYLSLSLSRVMLRMKCVPGKHDVVATPPPPACPIGLPGWPSKSTIAYE